MDNNGIQVDELREAILTEFKQVHKLAPADYTENCTNVVMSMVEALIQQKQLEARLDEAYLIGLKQERGEYLPATYLIDRRDELSTPPKKEDI